MNNNPLRVKRSVLILYLFPGVALFLGFVILPLLLSMRYSFFSWNGGAAMRFVGLGNYLELAKDPDFWNSFKNNIIVIVLCIIGQLGFALLLCGLFTSKLLKLKEFHRTVMFIPVVLSAIVVGFIWTLIYNKDLGILNMILKALHLQALIQPWLDDPKIVMFSVSAPLIWQYIGEYLIIFMAAVQSIDKSVLEVSEIDGCTGFNRLRYIIAPLISDTIKVAVMLCISGNMKVFDHIYVMTGGGPGNSSMVMAQYAYKTSFQQFKLGYGSTISVGILILSLTIIFISRKLGERKQA
ncbi:carbohydrate ABC transporter membrane protein 1 (CUT1 family) [Hydrogenispora ethanolica]|jgi:raffinose/stachyose/melibiose transport system permease protein|uniref:Carbohydrate ABC transporter membrane protein 1 (CUT1 family) n=1 Tax=Hydrogenispora ethanolica TaxID=1082276 RepID=A0A4R1RVF6_HYDET|nr:sugar ABC transporter permease [Hydrogenispora ethanolica]TCL70090.1 carbohydrate ABC transporter membrane protein 1 (CUT1 family) [Hydrogenispora ethanolica]